MPPEHLYYKEINAKDGAYYRRWAAAFGPYMTRLIDTVLRQPEHEEQAYNSCAGILHSCKDEHRALAEEAARTCIEIHSCKYSSFKKALNHLIGDRNKQVTVNNLPSHGNIRGKEHFIN